MSKIKHNDYKYTIEGWLTEYALANGATEVAESDTHKLTMKLSMDSYRRVNFFYIAVFKQNELVEAITAKDIDKARKLFVKKCITYKLNHKRYNPQ